MKQTFPQDRYEILVIDDGSSDGTDEMVKALLPHAGCEIRYLHREHKGAAAARNEGLRRARGRLIIFLDSDIIVVPEFVAAHVAEHDDEATIVHGPVIWTSSPENPTAARRKVTDVSRAFFATGNVSISREKLFEAGLFDEDFTEYGWEDLELGQRLKKLGMGVKRSEGPKGYHLKPEFRVEDLPVLAWRERERGHMAVLYYEKHPTLEVKMATMLTPIFFWLVRVLTLGDWPEWRLTARLLRFLERIKLRPLLSLILQIIIYYHYSGGMREALSWRK